MSNPDRFIPPEVDAELTPKTRAFVHLLFDRIDELTKRVEKLEAMLAKLTPQNSSIPPSTVHPHAKPLSKKPQSSRKRGGQPGHKRHQRTLIPTDLCDTVERFMPTVCRCCNQPLHGNDSDPLRHQVSELPPTRPIVTEYQLGRLQCPRCKITTCAELPNGVPTGAYGPRLIAFAGLLMGHFRQSKRKTSQFISDLLNIPCCSSMTVKMQNIVSQSLAAPHEDLRQALAYERNVHMDETPTKQADSKAWLWVATTKKYAVFTVFSSRAATAITHLLGEDFQGIVNCDRAKMYFLLKHLQWCWSHLIRDFQAMIDSEVPDRIALGTKLSEQAQRMFRNWHGYKAKELSWEQFQASTLPIAKKVNQLLYLGGGSHDRKLRNQCLSLHAHHENLWRFMCNEGIEPTNNTAERALRGPVIYRKLSFGTQSETGSRYVERIFSVIETCRLQNRSVFEYLFEAVSARLSKQKAPSLLTP